MTRQVAALLLVANLGACTRETPAPRTIREETRVETALGLPDTAQRPQHAEIWDLEVDPATNSVVIGYMTGNPSCWTFERVEAAYRNDEIEIAVYDAELGPDEKAPGGPVRVCTLEGIGTTINVGLSQPIAGRDIVAGSKRVSPGNAEVGPRDEEAESRTEFEAALLPDAGTPMRAPIERLSVDRETDVVKLTYFTGEPSCQTLARVEATYSDDRIALEVFHVRSDRDAVCTATAVPRTVEVALDEPVGDRDVVLA